MSDVFKCKSVENLLKESGEAGHSLPRVLGAFDVTMIGIGAIIGAGIFSMIGQGIGLAGPAVVLSFVLTSIACGFTALCYAELAAMVPISGSAYTYAYATLGELTAWIIGWDLILEYAISNVAVALSWSGYFNSLLEAWFKIKLPTYLVNDYRTFMQNGVAQGCDIAQVPHVLGIPLIFNVPAFLIVAALTVLLVIGIKESTRFNSLMVVLKLAVLAVFCVVGIQYFKIENWTPFMPNGWFSVNADHQPIGVLAGASVIFFAYIGFDAVSTVAEETKEPQRDMPLGIIGSLVICTIVYIVVAAVLTSMVPFATLKGTADPLVVGLVHNNAPSWIISIVALGAVISCTAVLLVFQMGQPRIFFAMSRDGLLPQYFAKIHERFKTPHVTTIWTGVVVAVLSGLCNINEMSDLCNIGTLFAFVLVCASVMILRRTDPDRPRPFKVPFGPLMPIGGILCCAVLMYGLPWVTWKFFFAWLVIGLVIYFSYGYNYSVLRRPRTPAA